MEKCKHKFRVLRQADSGGALHYGHCAVVQCEKCLKVFNIGHSEFEEISV